MAEDPRVQRKLVHTEHQEARGPGYGARGSPLQEGLPRPGYPPEPQSQGGDGSLLKCRQMQTSMRGFLLTYFDPALSHKEDWGHIPRVSAWCLSRNLARSPNSRGGLEAPPFRPAPRGALRPVPAPRAHSAALWEVHSTSAGRSLGNLEEGIPGHRTPSSTMIEDNQGSMCPLQRPPSRDSPETQGQDLPLTMLTSSHHPPWDPPEATVLSRAEVLQVLGSSRIS